MSPQEARETIRGLNELLTKFGLGWVVQQVAAVVERGVDQKTHIVYQGSEPDQPLRRPGPKAEALTTRAYSEHEELRLLIAAIRSVGIDLYQIEKSALAGLGSPNNIRFAPDLPAGFEDRGYDRRASEGFESTVASLEQRSEAVEELSKHLVELERLARA
ncbi:MAG: hypothetical protein QOE96_3277 [Blastocatellia bacterium]|jgi:hypothetical protein|nr:hypothetical protein [Blastocatellia bacterium]